MTFFKKTPTADVLKYLNDNIMNSLNVLKQLQASKSLKGFQSLLLSFKFPIRLGIAKREFYILYCEKLIICEVHIKMNGNLSNSNEVAQKPVYIWKRQTESLTLTDLCVYSLLLLFSCGVFNALIKTKIKIKLKEWLMARK